MPRCTGGPIGGGMVSPPRGTGPLRGELQGGAAHRRNGRAGKPRGSPRPRVAGRGRGVAQAH
eukprot:1884071-Lingulodinium_polyedra.AAC.1